MAQWGEVTARAYAPLLWHQGHHTRIEHPNKGFYQLRPHAARGPEEDIGAEEHDGANHVMRERRAHASGMTTDEIGLELIELVGGNSHVGEFPEAGIDPVDRLP
jgi:hypothetical protein